MVEAPQSLVESECRQLIALFSAGRHEDVEKRALRLIESFPEIGFAWKVLGASLQAQNKDAIAALRRATRLLPADAEAHSNLGCALTGLGNSQAAVAHFERALAIDPEFAAAHHNLGIASRAIGQLDRAVASFRRALRIKPDDAQVHGDLGLALSTLGQFSAAAASFRRAIEIKPGVAELHYNLACACQDLGRFDQAAAGFRQALALKADFAEAHHNLGSLLKRSGHLDDAMASLRRALACKPDHAPSQQSLGYALLARGEFEEGWRLCQARYSPALKQARIARLPDLKYPEWRGEPLAGKSILVWPEQGLGDAIQFCRFAAELKRRGARRVTLVCKPELQGLFATLQGVDAVHPTDRPEAPPPHDFWTLLLNIPLHCETRLDSIPATVPYLRADPARMKQVAALLAGTADCKVGLCWKGNAGYGLDAERSIGLPALRPLFAVPGVSYFALQREARTEFLATAGAAGVDLGHEVDATGPPFQETAALIMQLDLVITCDTSIGHLAGALGKPVWLLLAFVADWRWMEQREDSPWYPHTRLFRQRQPGNWGAVVQRVRDQLTGLAAQRAP